MLFCEKLNTNVASVKEFRLKLQLENIGFLLGQYAWRVGVRMDAAELLKSALTRSGLLMTGKNQQVGNLSFGSCPLVTSLSSPPNMDHNALTVRYRNHPLLSKALSYYERDFVRFDFQSEWNNLGFGIITLNEESAFSLAGTHFLPDDADIIGEVFCKKSGKKVCDYAGIIRTGETRHLWFNRKVGPIDGFDWHIVENFLSLSVDVPSSYIHPLVSEIPHGYSGAVTMRIDCDEAISTGLELFQLYAKNNVPFSLAIKTQQEIAKADVALMTAVLNAGGSIVGHSHTHAPNWGGSIDSAEWEARTSAEALRDLGIVGISYDYVVSPFHQNPQYAVKGLANAGVKGFVGGISCNDAEYLVARAGLVPGGDKIITHSQQCMFHGDIYRRYNSSIDIYKAAFKQALATETFFGYLDHPFSSYYYGWSSEAERLHAHGQFLEFLNSIPGIWMANLVDAMRFLEMKSTVIIEQISGNAFSIHLPNNSRFLDLPAISVKYGKKIFKLNLGESIVVR